MKWMMLLAMAVPAFGQATEVYKCRGAGGEAVYTATPCSPAAAPMQLRTTRAATPTEGEAANRQAVFRATELSDVRLAEQQCQAAAVESIQMPADRRIAGMQRQIAQLNARAAGVRNNLAGATLYTGIQTQISGLQGGIASERSASSAQMTAARTHCADQRRAAEEAVQQRYAGTGGG